MASKGAKSMGTRERQPKFPSAKTLLGAACSQQQQLSSVGERRQTWGKSWSYTGETF